MGLRGLVGGEGVGPISLGGVIGANRLIALFVPGTKVDPGLVLLDSAGELFLDARRRGSEVEVLP